MAKKKSGEYVKDDRTRQWAFVGYPGDSLPENYRQILTNEFHLVWCESPPHDADLNGDETEKKNHIHFILDFPGPKSYEQIKEITDRLNASRPEKVKSMRGYCRYLIHIDNPEKAQYKQSDIKCYGGFEIDKYFVKSAAQYRASLKDVIQFCKDNGIVEYSDLLDAVLVLDDDDWFDVITCKNTLAINAYLRSARHKAQDSSPFVPVI